MKRERKKKLKSLIRFHSANKIYKYTEAQCGVGWGGGAVAGRGGGWKEERKEKRSKRNHRTS